MTREEARNILESLSSDLWRELHPSQRDALDMAIEALQENESLAKSVNEASELLRKKRPHGEWIDEGVYADYVGQHVYKCTYCNDRIIEFPTELGSYCKYCGSDNRKKVKRND